ncbi:MAG: polyhydroxyalkanoate synthesis repressor PhaR [Alphaproteobacteria bacterium]|nr:polyhydroxyalkanoate synthesis repressor PhaR [Alphaproteobacteria bacterium]
MSEPVRTQPEDQPASAPPVVVKKYANRRLYNTESSSYITLDNLAEMIREGRDFVVYDAKSGEDITRGVLTQIIVEEEGKGRAMLPTGFLRQLIGFYGGNMQNLVPRYLEQAITAFADQQRQVRETMQQTMGRMFPFGNMEEVSRQNVAMMERAMSLWAPFYRPPPATEQPGAAPPSTEANAAPQQEIAALRAEVEGLRRQIAEMRSTPPPKAAPVSPSSQSTSGSERAGRSRQTESLNTKA